MPPFTKGRVANIDGDMILYERAFAAASHMPEGEVRDFEYVANSTDALIRSICEETGSEFARIFLTGKKNFRIERAVTAPYKGNRAKVEKPYHHENLLNYLLAVHKAEIVDHLEADDLLAIHQKTDGSTVLCTRDKDLLQVEGLQYGWECGMQPERKLHDVTYLGELKAKWGVGKRGPTFKKLTGEGIVWFYAQCIVGDMATDNIPGCPNKGPKKAWEVLSECTTEQQMFNAVCEAYEEAVGPEFWALMSEQADLVWMARCPDHYLWSALNDTISLLYSREFDNEDDI